MTKKKWLTGLMLTLPFIFLMAGCASSGAQRGAASEVDKAYISANYQMNHAGDSNLADRYQNSSQTAKGVIVGGATGAAAGGFSSIGILPGLFTGAIIGGAVGAYIDETSTLADKLANRGVRTVVLGDQVLIVMPSAIIFNPGTPDVRPAAYTTLDLVSELIDTYPNMMVKISAYTSQFGSSAVNLALSNQQAENVQKYLWRKKMNTRLLTAAGYGGCSLVTKDSSNWNSDNYRIEITLEKVPS